MARYAAVDIGSNSARLLVADPGNGKWDVLASDREVTRLGENVFRAGVISREALDFTSGVLARFARTCGGLNITAMRAVATAAVRDASNQQEFVDRASKALGAPVEIISGQEEARLIHLGVESRWPHPDKRVLIVDVGGGSAEIITTDSGKMTGGVSRPLGAVRLSSVFLRKDPPRAADLEQLHQFIEDRLAPALDKFGKGPWGRGIATSATAGAMICAVNRIPRVRREEADRRKATRAQVRRLFAELIAKDRARRAKIPGIGPRRAEIIVPGVAVLLQCMEHFDLPAFYYSTAGVRDGLVADLAARKAGGSGARLRPDQRRVVEAMARKFGVPLPHARKVAALAMQLFEALDGVHRLPAAAGGILEAAAILFDIGHFVSDTGHHKHSQYLVANADLPGFTDRERGLVAELCRFHRKSMPGPRHTSFQALPADDRKMLLALIPLLRLADALDIRKEQLVDRVECAFEAGGVRITAVSVANAELELWAAARAGAVFEEVFAMPVEVKRGKP